jgi:hypothetical protein
VTIREDDPPAGTVPIAAAINALREELASALVQARDSTVRFELSEVELTLQTAVTTAGTASAKVRWWLIELGGDASRESAVTQTLKLTLQPVFFDEDGNPLEQIETLIDTYREDRAANDVDLYGGESLEATNRR